MSTTLSTTQMVARLQRKFPLGLGVNDCMDFLNEGFRKIDQMSKGGFIWQLNVASLVLPAGAATPVPLPADFDPGKSAWMRCDPFSVYLLPTLTEIPYKPYKEFVNQEHFQVNGVGNFACWTFTPSFILGPPLVNFKYILRMAPVTAYPLPGNVTLDFFYHSVAFAPLNVGPAIYFPTPDQFDSFIIDLAEAELARVYKVSGFEKVAGAATAALAEMIDNYRTDRFDLAGLMDETMQAQEKGAERAR